MTPSPFSLAALAAELTIDPASVGYAASVDSGSDGITAALINAQSQFVWAPIPVAQVLKWSAANGTRLLVEQAATATGPFASGGSSAITGANQAMALAVRDLLTGSTTATLDITDPDIVGSLAGGAVYTPGNTVSIAGLIDAMVAAKVLVDGLGGSLKDSLINLGKTPASRATVLWGYGFATNPFGPTSVSISTTQIAQALRV